MTVVLKQLFQISLECGLCSTIASKDFLTSAGKSSASMFCHFNSSRAIVLLQLGRTEKANPVERQGTQIRDQRRVIPLAHEVFIPAVAARRSSLRVINSSTALLDLKTTPGATGRSGLRLTTPSTEIIGAWAERNRCS